MPVYKETSQEVPFLNYKTFDNRDIIFSVFIFRRKYVINAIAPFKIVKTTLVNHFIKKLQRRCIHETAQKITIIQTAC